MGLASEISPGVQEGTMENRRALGWEPGEETPPHPPKEHSQNALLAPSTRGGKPSCPQGMLLAWRISQGKPHPKQPEESQENHVGKLKFLQKAPTLPIPLGKLLLHVLSSWPAQEETKDALGAGAPGLQEDPSPVPPAQEKSYTASGPKTLKIPSITPLWGSPFNDLSMFSSPGAVSDISVSQAHRDMSLPKNIRSYCSPGKAESSAGIMGTEMFGKHSFPSYPACPIIQNL